jgi:acetyltransferase-like isoleucine patch superfamily enzyme
LKNFDEWNEVKKRIDSNTKLLHFREREVFFLSIGMNVGFEVYGKGNEFLRPVVILKKFSRYSFLGVPLSSKLKDGNFYHKVEFSDRINTALISQIRTFDAKRLKYQIGRLSIKEFAKLKDKISYKFNLSKERSGHVPSNKGLSNSDLIVSENKQNINKNEINLINSQTRDITYGKNVKVVIPSNLYECFLDDNVFVGPFCEIQKGVKIGKNTRIQSHTFICELVTIGKNCFIGHGVMFINDLFKEGKPTGDSQLWKETIIKDNVSIGSNATILPVRICSNVVIGAGSVVTKDITESGIYAGNPAVKIRNL